MNIATELRIHRSLQRARELNKLKPRRPEIKDNYLNKIKQLYLRVMRQAQEPQLIDVQLVTPNSASK